MTVLDFLSVHKNYPIAVKFNFLQFSHQYMIKLSFEAILSKKIHIEGVFEALENSIFAPFARSRKGTFLTLGVL